MIKKHKHQWVQSWSLKMGNSRTVEYRCENKECDATKQEKIEL